VSNERLKIAVFIDFDNIEIGVKSTLNTTFDVGAVLDAIKERGEVVTKVAYGDWKRAGEHSRALTQQAIRMVQRNMTPGGDKNGADINLALDALEMALTHQHINAYVIVGGDSDFISLVEKLKQYDKTVFVVGGRAFTSVILQKNCHEFIAYENLIGPQGGRRAPGKGRPASQAPIKQAFPLIRRALKVLVDREVSPQLGLLKSTLLQLDSSFSERDYGVSSFRDFAERLAEAGLVRLNQQGRSVLVELKDGARDSEADVEPAKAALQAAAAPAPAAAVPTEPAEASASALGQPADAVHAIRAMFEAAPGTLRWPMYVRNIKQYARSVDARFDERRYGFAGILDLLRACQREGIFRLERDRKGVLRVFPGVLIQRIPSAGTPVEPHEADLAAVMTPEAVEPGGVVEAFGDQPSMAAAAETSETGLAAGADSSAAATEAGAASLGGKRGRRRRSAATPRRSSASPKAASTRPRARKKTPA
jgi:uncharacterized LabA/DUF88 family protein